MKDLLNFKKDKFLSFEIGSLILLLIFLPSFEAPKNLFLVIYVILSLIRQHKISYLTKLEKIDYIFIFLFVAAFLATVFSALHGQEWKGFTSFFKVFIFGWTFARSQYSKEIIKLLFLTSILTLLPPLLYGLYGFLWAKNIAFLKINSVGFVNASGLYLMTAASAALGYFLTLNFRQNQKFQYLFYVILVTLFGFSLIVAGSRSAFFAFIVSTLALILFLKINFKRIILSVLAASLAFSFLLNAPVFEKHMRNIRDNNTLAYRDKLWNVSIESAQLFSFKLGTGIGNYGFVDEDIIKRSVEDRGEIYDAKNYFYSTLTHNVYLSYLVERGFLGFLSLITFMIFWFNSLFQNIKKLGRSDQHDYLWAGSLGGFISVYLVGLVHTTLVFEPAILALFLFGLYHMYCRLYIKKQSFNT